jgi:hypothetical protein
MQPHVSLLHGNLGLDDVDLLLGHRRLLLNLAEEL